METAAEILVRMARDAAPPVVSEFDLYLLARRLFADRGYGNTPIPPRNRTLSARRARTLVSQAIWNPAFTLTREAPPNKLPHDPEFLSPLYIAGQGDTVAVMMAADPFCCLSHASAVAFHGMGDESSDVHLVAPDRAGWVGRATRLMEQTIGKPIYDIDSEDVPFRPVRPRCDVMVRGRRVQRHEMRHPIVAAERGDLRATAIGETFRDSLDKPEWCGGIDAVIALWQRHAAHHRDAIIATVDASSEKILRVRAGYLLEEMLGIDDPRVAAWVSDAQRGSSRKLDAAAPYASRFSERWMLSINAADASLPSQTL